MRPVWLCPRGRDAGTGRRTRSSPARTYVNVGFWGTVHVGPEAAEAPRNRAIEAKVHELGGHKSLYSEAFYDRGDVRRALRRRRTSPAVKRRTTPTTGSRASTTRRCDAMTQSDDQPR